MRLFTASAIAWVLGMVGWWCLEGQARVHEWSGIESDFWKVGGTD